jgi:acetyl esterase
MEATFGDAGAPPAGSRPVAVRAALAALHASLKVSPRPMVWVIRRAFAKNGARVAASHRARVPSAVRGVLDERYDEHPDARLDVFTPDAAARAGRRLPTVVWTHGGGFVAGSKNELRDYLRIIAAAEFTVVGVDYTPAPESRHPTPARQVMAALRHLEANADRLHLDPTRLVLAGDSAGAHITAQVATIVTNPVYGSLLGVASTIWPDRLRAVVLCCGVYDLSLISPDTPLRDFVLAVGWAYSGTRDFRHDERFMATTSLPPNVTEAFPPAFITAGNADPLLPQSHALHSALESKGVAVETLFFADDHEPPLPHEYQFDLELADGRAATDRLIAFLRNTTSLP